MNDTQFGASPAAMNLVKIIAALPPTEQAKQRAKVTNFLAQQGAMRKEFRLIECSKLAKPVLRWWISSIKSNTLELDPKVKTHMQNVAIGQVRDLYRTWMR